MSYENKQSFNFSFNIGGQATIEELKSKLREAKDYIQQLVDSVEELNNELDNTRSELSSTESELDSFRFGDKIQELKKDSERLADITRRSLREFRSYLRSVNLDEDIDFDMMDLVERVKEGTVTVQQAITQVKSSYRALIEENYSKNGGLFDSQQVQTFTAALDNLSERIDGIVNQVANLLQTGAGQNGGISDVGTGLQSVANAALSIGALSGEEANVLLQLVDALNEYATVDADKLKSVAVAFDRIAALSEGKISASTVNNLSSLATTIQGLNQKGTVMLQFSVNGWNDLKVRKPTVDNIITLLTFLDEHSSSVDTLNSLASIDFSKLSTLSDADFEKLKVLPDNTNLQQELNTEQTAIDKITDRYREHIEVVGDAIAAEKEKGQVARNISKDLNAEEEALKKSSDAAKKHESAINKLTGTAKPIKGDAYSLIKNSLIENGANDSDADELARNVTSRYEDIGGTITKITAKVDKLGSEEARVANITIDKVDEAGRSYKLYLNYVRDVVKAKGKEAELVWRQTNNQNGGIIKYNFDTDKDDAAAYSKYINTYNSIIAQIDRLSSAGGDSPWLSNALTGYISELNNLYASYQGTDEGRRAFDIGLQNLQSNIKATTGSVTQYVNAQSDAAKNAKLIADNNTKYTKTQGELTEAIQSYSYAEKSSHKSSVDAYAAIKNLSAELEQNKINVDAGTMSQEDFAKNLTETENELTRLKSVIKGNGDATKSWSDQFKDMAKQLSTWVTPMRILMKVIQTIKKMVSASIELNDAMTQMQIVTKATDSQMAKFGETAAAASKRIASSITDFISSATTYARLGYNTEESSMFAEYTAMLQNVGDIDVEDAQNAVTAIVKAFDIPADKLKEKMDEIVTIGNGFPISVSQIAEGMNNASSTLAAAGNSFEQSVALLTAANTTVQNASKAATGLRTITARLRNTKTDLEELGEEMTESKYEEIVSTLTGVGVALTDVNNNYRSTYDIMKDIADAWDEMNDERKSALVTQLAGTRQQDIFYSIINQFREAEKAYGEMVNNSAGALDTAYSTYLNSATAHINQFKAAFQELSGNFIDSKMVADVADLGSKILKAANGITTLTNNLGGLRIVLVLITGILASINAETIINKITSFGERINKLQTVLDSFTNTSALVVPGTSKLSVALDAVGLSASSAKIALGTLTAVIGAVLIAINAYNKAVEEKKRKSEEAFGESISAAKEADSLYNLYEAYKKANNSYEDGVGAKEALTTATNNLAEALGREGEAAVLSAERLKKLSLEELKKAKYDAEDALSIANKLAADDFVSGAGGDYKGILTFAARRKGVKIDWTNPSAASSDAIISTYEELVNIRNQLLDKEKSQNGKLGYFDKKRLDDARGAIDYLSQSVGKLTDARETLSTITKRYNDILNDSIIAENTTAATFESSITKDNLGILKAEIKEYQEMFDEASQMGANLSKTVFGNIDTNNRQVLEWNLKTIRQFMKELPDWLGKNESIFSLDGYISTVMGSLENFDGVDIAFSPILQTDDGPKLLSKDTVYKYISSLIKEINDKDGWFSEDLFALDARGLMVDGIEIKNLIADIGETAKQTSESMHYMGADGALNGTIPAIKAIAEQYGVTVEEIIAYIKRLETESAASTYGGVQELEKGFKLLGEVYDDIKDKGTFDYSKIFNNKDFDEEFKDVGEEYDAFLKTVAESPNDIQKCQTAFNNLSKAYIIHKHALENVTEETRDTTVAMLTQDGIVNAAEIVDSAISQNTNTLESLSSAYQSATGTSYDFANATEADILALYNEQTAGSLAKKIVAQLYIEKRNLNNTQINTANDVEQLLNIAKAAGAGAQYLINLQNALNNLNNIPSRFYDEYGNPLHGIENVKAREKYIQNQLNAANRAANDMTFEIEIPEVNWSGYSGPTTGNKSSGGGSKSDSDKEKENDEFLQLYKEHKHLVEMDKETLKEFYDWLDGNEGFKKYYKKESEYYWKYEEEVHKGLRDLTKDEISDIEHKLSMYETYGDSTAKQYALILQAIDTVEKAIAQARKDGLKDNDDYIQELQKQLSGFVKQGLDLRDKAKDEAKSTIEKLVEFRVKMLKKEIDDEKEANKKKLDSLKETIDKQKKLLRDERDEEKYLDEQAEKRKAVYDIETQIAQLAGDNSAWAAKKRLELEQDLSDKRKELQEFERDHQIETAEDQLDKLYELEEAEYNRQNDLLDKKSEDAQGLYQQALDDIRNGSVQLYNEMIEWNDVYGDGLKETVTSMWEQAYVALKDYKELFGEYYELVKLVNATNYNDKGTWNEMAASDAGSPNGTTGKQYVERNSKKSEVTVSGYGSGDIDGDGKVTAADARLALRAAVKLESLSQEQIKRGDLDGDGKITAADARRIMNKAVGRGYASGTSSASFGIHGIDEKGDETVFQSRDGRKYKLFAGGEKVLNAKASDFLYNFANSGGEILQKIVKNAMQSDALRAFGGAGASIEIRTGDIVIEGNADKATVSEIRRAQREQVDLILKSFNRLKA